MFLLVTGVLGLPRHIPSLARLSDRDPESRRQLQQFEREQTARVSSALIGQP